MRLVPPYIESLEPERARKPTAELQKEPGLKRVVKLASNVTPWVRHPSRSRSSNIITPIFTFIRTADSICAKFWLTITTSNRET